MMTFKEKSILVIHGVNIWVPLKMYLFFPWYKGQQAVSIILPQGSCKEKPFFLKNMSQFEYYFGKQILSAHLPYLAE